MKLLLTLTGTRMVSSCHWNDSYLRLRKGLKNIKQSLPLTPIDFAQAVLSNVSRELTIC